MNAYPETMLNNVRSRMADILDYAVNDCRMEIDDFFTLFLASEWCRALERGDRRVALGMSGIEIVECVLADKLGRVDFPKASERFSRTPEYWTGWIVAFYQWRSGHTFSEISSVMKMSEIVGLYKPYHEAPEDKFADMSDDVMKERLKGTRLSRMRRAYGCTQEELAKLSGVGVRNIQMYEQRRNDINCAEAGKVRQFARVLGCSMEDLLEG